MAELVNAQAFWKLAEAMGMDPDAFRWKYATDAPFNALVSRHLAALERVERLEAAAREPLDDLTEYGYAKEADRG